MSAAARDPLSNLRAKIHIAKKQANLTDDQYRAFLEAATGVESTARMDESQMRAVLRDFIHRLGFKPNSPKPQTSPHTPPNSRWLARPSNWADPNKNPLYSKLYAMICANKKHDWNWGYVRGTAKNMFANSKSDGVVVLEFLTGPELHKVTQALQMQSNRLKAKSSE